MEAFISDESSTDLGGLQCRAQGGPGNAFKWHFGENIVGEEDMLEINQTAREGGEYLCVVRNAAGSGNASVIVNGK